MTYSRAIRELRALKTDILSDEKVDWEESERLLTFVRPLSLKFGKEFRQFEQLLIRCRIDGHITEEESELLALQLNLICSHFALSRMRIWLIVAIGVALLLAIFAY